MGQRHNRRRSRPRGRGQHKVDSRPDVYEARAILSDVDFAVGILPGQYQMNQMWMQKLAEEGQREAERLAEEQQRIFGGEIGDEVSLCFKMLDVIVGLFGDMDYVDP
ncbi:hypothetical protein GP486_007260 [Trichoglossum hirsutum]|uniref:Uncharacterized protein n=1 Tax=Trichoglossum hirsutum TaxID=265104 RepID=A0A9P8I6P2_9PEZI|nr:hypothetical protein GP486_007260 [Trichoglossum hirsutum]